MPRLIMSFAIRSSNDMNISTQFDLVTQRRIERLRIDVLRAKKKITKTTIAHEANVSLTAVCSYLKGTMDSESIENALRALDII